MSQVLLLHAFPGHPDASALLARLQQLSCSSGDTDTVCAAAKVCHTMGMKCYFPLQLPAIA